MRRTDLHKTFPACGNIVGPLELRSICALQLSGHLHKARPRDQERAQTHENKDYILILDWMSLRSEGNPSLILALPSCLLHQLLQGKLAGGHRHSKLKRRRNELQQRITPKRELCALRFRNVQR